MTRLLLIGILMFLCTVVSCAQDSLPLIDKIADFPTNFLSRIQRKAGNLEEQLYRHSEKVLRRMERREAKLRDKLMKKDSTLASKVFEGTDKKYRELLSKLPNAGNILGGIDHGYLPHFDTLKTSLDLLGTTEGSISRFKGAIASLNQLKELQSRLRQAEAVRTFVRERKQQLNDQLSQLGFARELKQFNKEVYYYSAQIKEYRALLEDPDKLERKALSLIERLPAFKNFMSQHSEFASLFRLPDDNSSVQSLQGLQTRVNVQALVQNRISAGGPNAQAMVRQQLQQAQAQLSELKDRVLKSGGGSSDDELPDFRPNNQRIKTFWDRLEYGTNIQSVPSNYFLPVTTDIGLSLGYKLNDKSVIGIGASYKMGWGKDITHIAISNEGVGLRSYLDYKIKGSFLASGGFEMNYRSAFHRLDDLRAFDSWQQSGLIGISKVLAVKTKFFKKTRVNLLWDFLSYKQVPRTQAILFRIGYNF